MFPLPFTMGELASWRCHIELLMFKSHINKTVGLFWLSIPRITFIAGTLPRRYDMNGIFQMQGGKNWICRNRSMQTGFSGTLIGWKSGQTTFVPLWDRMEGAWLWTQLRKVTLRDYTNSVQWMYAVCRLRKVTFIQLNQRIFWTNCVHSLYGVVVIT